MEEGDWEDGEDDFGSWSSEKEQRLVNSMVKDAFSLTPWLGRSRQDKVRLTEACREALLLGSNVFGVHHAAQTAGVYHFNPQHI